MRDANEQDPTEDVAHGRLFRTLPLLVLIVLLGVKYLAVVCHPLSNELVGDEYDYVRKARTFWETGSFPSLRGGDEGALRYSDFRPPGYAVLLAPLLAFGDSPRDIHRALRVAQSILDILLTIVLFLIACTFSDSRVYRCACAGLLGIQPWTSAWVVIAVTETVVTFLVVLGTLALARYVVSPRPQREAAWLAAGSLLLNATFAIRPEMIVLAPPLVAAAVALRRPNLRGFVLHGALALAPFLLVCAGLAFYWNQVSGEMRVVGHFRHATPGLVKWSCTWIAPESVKCAVVFQTWPGRDTRPVIPESAYDGELEKARVHAIIERAYNQGGMTADDDREFMAIAEERIRRAPWRYYFWVRAYNSGLLWMNLETSTTILNTLSHLPRIVSKGAVGAFLLLKIVVLLTAFVGAVRFWRNRRVAIGDWTGQFLLLGILFVVTRTILFGFWAMAWEHRYAAPAWPFVLALTMYGLAGVSRSWWAAADSDATA